MHLLRIFLCVAVILCGAAAVCQAEGEEIPGNETVERAAPASAARLAYEKSKMRLIASVMSMASYEGDTNVLVRNLLAEGGWEVNRYIENNAMADAQCFLFQRKPEGEEENISVLAITGTQSEKNAEEDLRIRRVPFGGDSPAAFRQIADRKDLGESYPLVHQGFENHTWAALFVKPIESFGGLTLGEYLAEKLKANPQKKLYLTGHSLGGAVAVLAAARLSDMGVPAGQMEVISFGAPAIGNKAFAQMYENRFTVENVGMKGDPVKGILQAVAAGYVQFGETVELPHEKSRERFPHEMVYYVDGAIRSYCKAKEAAGMPEDSAFYLMQKPTVQAKIYIAPLQSTVDESLRETLPYFEIVRKEIFAADIADPVFGEKNGHVEEICAMAKAAGCDYVLIQQMEGERLKYEKEGRIITMDELLYDKDGNLLGMNSSMATTKEMTALEAEISVLQSGQELRLESLRSVKS